MFLNVGQPNIKLSKVIGYGSNCTPMGLLCFTTSYPIIMVPAYDLFFISRNLER